MENSLLVTGASGTLGKAIVHAAHAAGVPVRQAVRDLNKANPEAGAVRFDYTDPATIPPAVSGVSRLVLIAPPLEPNAPAQLSTVIAAAKAAGVRQIVFVSALSANHNEEAPLRKIEHLVMDSGVAYTILRPNFFMENFSEGFLASAIKEQNAIYLAAADAKTSFISVRDVAAAALAALQHELTEQEYDLTGPEALDHTEVANIISEVAGRPVVYRPLTEAQMLQGARSLGMPEPAIGYMAALYSGVRAGDTERVTADFEKITGRRPESFAEFACIAAPLWK